MSFGVCLHFEDYDRDVWSGRSIDLDAWRYALKAFGGDRMAVINLTGDKIAMNDESVAYEEHSSLASFLAAHQGETMVFVELGGSDLAAFEHPADCWYVFGGTTVSLPRADVEIPTGGLALHPVHCWQMVAWDRFSKGGR